MLEFIKYKKEYEMLKKILFSLLIVTTLSIANSSSGVNYQEENRILKLKLEIYELKAENKELKKIIDDLSVNSKGDNERATALLRLKRELRMSRRTRK